jgi:hypothetical protein
MVVSSAGSDCAEVSEFFINRNFLNGWNKTSVGVTLVTQKDKLTQELLL